MFLLRRIDDFLNAITMYRVILYGLILLFSVSLLYSLFGIITFTPLQLVISLGTILFVCYLTNKIFSKLFNAATNVESWIITAFILFFIVSPPDNLTDYITVSLTGFVAMASKYLLTIHKKHIFNPAAISVFILGLFGYGASWWVGSSSFMSVMFIIGLLIVRKIRRFRLFFSFAITAFLTILFFGLLNNLPLEDLIVEIFTSWPLIFFATIMLTEPLTTPPTKYLQILYGIIVGLIFGAPLRFGIISSTPEFALIIGNIFSFIFTPQVKLFLTLKEKNPIAQNLYEFSFVTTQKLNFVSGQYLEWTLPHKQSDSRGNRRYFTIASSPTEENIKLGVKIFDNPSSFKKALNSLDKNTKLIASQLSGDFTLPQNEKRKLVFIAGGIGVTPFRSMIKYLLDKGEKREITIFYAAITPDEFAYKDIFTEAEEKIGIRVIYVLTDSKKCPPGWTGKSGYLTEEMIKESVPDFKERTFYLSGPIAMVNNYKKLLSKLGVQITNIVTDYFPGF